MRAGVAGELTDRWRLQPTLKLSSQSLHADKLQAAAHFQNHLPRPQSRMEREEKLIPFTSSLTSFPLLLPPAVRNFSIINFFLPPPPNSLARLPTFPTNSYTFCSFSHVLSCRRSSLSLSVSLGNQLQLISHRYGPFTRGGLRFP